jgi:hypothetical protein
MTIDERIEGLSARVEGLIMTAELHQKDLQSLGSYIQTDAGTFEPSPELRKFTSGGWNRLRTVRSNQALGFLPGLAQ